MMDIGRYIYVVNDHVKEPIIIDKASDSLNIELLVLRSLTQIEGRGAKDKILLQCFRKGLEYGTAEKWLNLGLNERCILNFDDVVEHPPVFETSDFTKGEVKKIIKESNRHFEVWRGMNNMADLMWTKELVKKPRDRFVLGSLDFYVRKYKEGLLSMKTFNTFSEKKMEDEIRYNVQLREARRLDYDYSFPYTDHYDLGDYEIVSPKKFTDLVELGRMMNNCLGNYPEFIKNNRNNKVLLLKKKEDNKILVAIETMGFMVKQALRKNNKVPSVEEMLLIETWMAENELVKAHNFNEFAR